ncbi:MAG: flavodoxin [Clostridia bacterium]|nr:flavodoxin [Clostridia bacterium]
MKRILALAFIAVIFTACSLKGFASDNSENIKIELSINSDIMYVNGNEMPIDDTGTQPVIIEGRTLIHVRAVIEAMGGNADWDGGSNKVLLRLNDNEIELTINSKTARLNNDKKILDVSPVIINGRTMLPIRFIAESFGFDVDWNSDENKITISNGSADNNTQSNLKGEGDGGQKVLVAYYSLSDIVSEGMDAVTCATPYNYNTETAASIIQSNLGGDLFKITAENTYPVNHSEASKIAKEELDSDYRPALTNYISNIDDYDIVFIGYPIWHQKAPMAVRSFLEEYDFSGKTIIPFSTALGSGISESVKDIENLCPNSVIEEGLSLSTEDSNMQEDIENWLNDLDFTPLNTGQEETMPIKLTIGYNVYNGYLNNTRAAKDLISRLPVTVELNNSDNDFCGAINPPLDYDENEVQYGYKNGDIAFWTAGDDFVIFVDDEEKSQNTGNLVILGNITEDVDEIKNSGNVIQVLIEKAY